VNFRQLAYGLLSFVPGMPETLYKGTGGTISAEYCYCIWLRHLVLARNAGMEQFPDIVGELGPGDSIGVGLAALLSGAKRYIALDAMAHADIAINLQVLDGLVELFRRETPIPGRVQFPEIAPDLPDHVFPHGLLDRKRLHDALADDRIAWLRALVKGEHRDSSVIEYRAPWECVADDDAGSVDFILTNAVMEHVMDLPAAYAAMFRWLRPGGHASHQIDFRSHSLFRAWDGHWACADWLWRLFIGRRPYLLNREPFATHRSLARASGFHECCCVRIEREPVSGRLAKRFRNMDARDRITSSGYLLLRRNERP
jgi:SAM-dependent methyltransferase